LPIGRLFTLGSFFENRRSCPNFWATFFIGNSHVFITTINGFGYISGDFFRNSSCHPGSSPLCFYASSLFWLSHGWLEKVDIRKIKFGLILRSLGIILIGWAARLRKIVCFYQKYYIL
jgi:hypothetical protein